MNKKKNIAWSASAFFFMAFTLRFMAIFIAPFMTFITMLDYTCNLVGSAGKLLDS